MPRADIIYRPIKVWPPGWRERKSWDRKVGQFRSSLDQTLRLLYDETRMLKVRRNGLVLQVSAPDRAFRKDETLRADAVVDHPGLILTVDSQVHGSLVYATDRFSDWQDNLRAIALGMEALRAVDRYGISDQGQQYAGYRAIGSGIAMGPATMSPEQAARLLSEEAIESPLSGRPVATPDEVLEDPGMRAMAYKVAARRHHPDNGGDPARFDAVTKAREILEAFG